ncbi:MAG: SGNH/GDSL hydrolase family protein [Bacteroidota bacterium]
MEQHYTYLALGDSYTIGESLLLTESFPYQTVQLLRKKGLQFSAPEIIAKTGFTTDELEEAIAVQQLLPKYDFVTLLIGVNNQYRGRDEVLYKMEFEELLKKAIAFCNGKPSHVIVLSIPDYSSTPFAIQMNKEKIAKEIDVFNNINHSLSIQYKVHYANTAATTKDAEPEQELFAADGLHPSGRAYKKWAETIAEIIVKQMK